MKFYRGRRTEYGCAVDVEDDGKCCLLNTRLDLGKLSFEGLDWGYCGGGAAQLALALAADATGDDDKARKICQRLKYMLIGGLPHEGWVLSEGQVRAAIEAIEREQCRSR